MSKDSPVNLAQSSPNDFLVSMGGKNFWKENLENSDYVRMYRRGGIAYRVFNKEKNLLFKNGFTTNNPSVDNKIKDLNLVEVVKYARLNAQISGVCPIYLDFNDVQTDSDYNKPAPDSEVVGFYVIPMEWIERDIYSNGITYDYYRVYRADGSIFEIHKSRMYRAKIDPQEISKLEPAYNALQVGDNVLWGTGQAMFRNATGFPVLSVDGATELVDYQGQKITRAKYYKRTGFFKNLNSEVGFIKDKRDEFEFVGAAGKALDPVQYWDIAIQAIAIALDTPVDILKGVSAGAISGSVTNLREYLSDLTGKQITEIKPIVTDLLKYTKEDVEQLEIEFNPLWEMTPQEITDTYSKDVIAFNNAENAGFITHEQVIKYFGEQYPEMNYLPNQTIPRPNPIVNLSPQQQSPNASASSPLDKKSSVLPKHLDIYQIRSQYDMTDSDIKKTLDAMEEEPSALPENVQKVVDRFRKDLVDTYKDTAKNVESILVGYNTDAKKSRV